MSETGTGATRHDVWFPSEDGARCAATLYLPDGRSGARPPVIVMAHGLGAIRAMGLAAYAERFTAAGYACLVFDYRHFGDSEGMPRYLLSTREQRADWAAAIAFARRLPQVDGDRIVAWGTSFGGGHAIYTAAQRPAGLVAAIAQCPFTDGIASTLAIPPINSVKATLAGVRDVVGALLGRAPYMITTAGPVHGTALMTAPDAESGYLALVPPGSDFRNEAAARVVFDILTDRPGRLTDRIEVPILFAVCETDSVAPAKPTLRYAARAPRGEVRTCADGHFDIYRGAAFERVVADQLDFLRRHVALTPEGAPQA
ncbi:alpha/beta hydrolase [Nocardia aurantiaca]|uniref:Alpha/beta fold hydrolase n=1 Tax=Nocardia aurantiaca TaxID=2675850 RepID=A0A6I3KYX5_9NOCA|nr:alpha/beta hydrolase [Nocardia aurantiaca]MTE13444.1 alpha/beta fold hydrolase [Nocardia aurantiaca]